MNTYLAIVPRPLESICADELVRLGATSPMVHPGAVQIQATEETLYRINLWSRYAMRILWVLDDFHCEHDDHLYERASRITWEDYLSETHTFSVRAHGTTPTLRNSMYTSQRIKDALVDRFLQKRRPRPSVDRESPHLSIYAQLYTHEHRYRCTIAIDSSGSPLFQRGYREPGHEAPIKENLAAAILSIAHIDTLPKETPLLDLFCGSGTFLLEAAMMKLNIAPGLRRSFAFERWPHHRPNLFDRLQQEAHSLQLEIPNIPFCYGVDNDPTSVQQAHSSAHRLGLESAISVVLGDTSDAKPPTDLQGCIVSNPPYGYRLGHTSPLSSTELGDLSNTYKTLGDVLKQRFSGWTAFIYTANVVLGKHIGLRPSKRWTLYNGPLEGRLLRFDLWKGSNPNTNASLNLLRFKSIVGETRSGEEEPGVYSL